MTRDQFDKTWFGPGMEFYYEDGVHSIAAVDFKEALLAYRRDVEASELSWLRCESVNIILDAADNKKFN